MSIDQTRIGRLTHMASRMSIKDYSVYEMGGGEWPNSVMLDKWRAFLVNSQSTSHALSFRVKAESGPR